MKPSQVFLYVAVATSIGWAIGILWNTHDRLNEPRMSREITVQELEKEQVLYDR